MAMDVDCLYSSIKNISGQSQYFGFIGPRGTTLAANEEYTQIGNPYSEMMGGVNRVANIRNLEAFEAAVARGDLEIVNTAAVILRNDAGDPKMLRIDRANNLSLSDPCWTSSS